MKITMRLNENAFNRMKKGEKIREYRVNDEKRKNIRISDTIEFQKLPDLQEKIYMDVTKIEHFDSLETAINAHFETDFQKRHKSVEDAAKSFYEKGFYQKEEVQEYGVVVFEVKKHRISHLNATVCYLKKDNKILMLQFNKKWGQVYAPPGGKFESGESPIDCILREYKEETGLTLKGLKLQGISYWKDSEEGMIFIYTCEDFEGSIKESEEGKLKWINENDLINMKQFEQNEKFTPYLFKEEIFEGKFLLDDNCKVLNFEIRKQ